MDKYFIVEHLLSGYSLYVLEGLPPHQNTISKITLNDKYNMVNCIRISEDLLRPFFLALKEYRIKNG